MGVRVTTATPADWPAAAGLLAAGDPARAARHLDLLHSGELDPAGLFVTSDRDGAVLAQRMPGALGLVWPPRAGSARAEDALLGFAGRWLRAGGVKVGQAFAADPPDALERAGFRRTTEVVHLRRDVPELVDVPPGPLELVPLTAANRPAFAAALLATHDGSRDCPELTGDRTPDELLAGFAGSLADRPGWRLLARDRGESVGVLLFDAGVEPGAVELSYLGLVPAARGKGFGDVLVRHALRFAAADGATVLTLSVDARNEPARGLYARHGFREAGRRAVWLAEWPAS